MTTTDPQGFDYDTGLFDVPDSARTVPEPKEKLSRTAQQHRKVARRIGAGIHPLGEPIRLHPDAPRDLDYQEAKRSTAGGPRCGSCRFREIQGWPKCMLPTVIGGRTIFPRNTGSDASDVAAWWPACTNWEPR
ncbi:hypothetical protein [Mycobacterium sp. TY815]|uniref:hypothetical protein n=1 Tax=Mycobacterium sp. TY815 TaxID=3050581 RepID=UPI0027429423|nr:hypothetical protein [Mycobacterium sp. TY815]MDP7706829.1 hypothetical protein [Mycobacterium sp. TY815]